MQMISIKEITLTQWARAVPDQKPAWDYNNPGDILARNRFVTCLLAGLLRASLTAVNYKIKSKGSSRKELKPHLNSSTALQRASQDVPTCILKSQIKSTSL